MAKSSKNSYARRDPSDWNPAKVDATLRGFLMESGAIKHLAVESRLEAILSGDFATANAASQHEAYQELGRQLFRGLVSVCASADPNVQSERIIAFIAGAEARGMRNRIQNHGVDDETYKACRQAMRSVAAEMLDLFDKTTGEKSAWDRINETFTGGDTADEVRAEGQQPEGGVTGGVAGSGAPAGGGLGFGLPSVDNINPADLMKGLVGLLGN